MAKLISKTYGDALFETALEKQTMDFLFEEAQVVLEAFSQNPKLSELMVHPKILKEEKLQIVEEIFKGRVSDDMTGFLVIIVKKDRFGEICNILEYFISRVKEYKGIGVATVTTPMELNEAQKSAVCAKLLETTSYREMEMHYQVDEALIGGMVIRIGDRVVDSSVATKLEELKRQLLKIQLA